MTDQVVDSNKEWVNYYYVNWLRWRTVWICELLRDVYEVMSVWNVEWT